MRSFLLHIICVVALFSSCDWVNDDLSNCPTGTWLKLSYTYNILNVDAASTQVGDITILAFDKNDKYVDRLDVDSVALHQGYCMVRVPFPEGTYRLLIWGGISDSRQYQLPNLTVGQTDRKSLNISLACDENNQTNGKLKALFHSSLDNVTVSEDYQVITAELVKDTNYFSCILQDEDNTPLQAEDFSFTLESANGVIDYANMPVGTTTVGYLPYQQEVSVLSEQIPVIHARLNTLRLMKGDNTTLLMRHVPSGEVIMRLSLTQYLLLSKIYNYIGDMGDQEYLDRQDSYTLLFFIKSSGTGIPKLQPMIKVNGWTIRLNSAELESSKFQQNSDYSLSEN